MRELIGVPMLETVEGRALLGYLAACALPQDTAAFGDFEEHRYVFPGKVGMAPGWPDQILTGREQRWVSACILASRSITGEDIEISMRANLASNPMLEVSEEERRRFTLHEGGFFGNLFLAEPLAFVCIGDRNENESHDPVLLKRNCTARGDDDAMTALGLTACGYRLTGVCSQIGAPQVGGVSYVEVIDVYLEPEAD